MPPDLRSSSDQLSQYPDPDALLPHCWRLQDCRSCLSAQYQCSWCATSSVCIANPVTWPILSPIWEKDVCPTRDERWELRGNELGCDVSPITFLSVVVAFFSTLTLIAAIWFLGRAWTWSRGKWKRWFMSGKFATYRTGRWIKAWTPLRVVVGISKPSQEDERLLG